MLVLKHFERYTYHLKVASELRDTIEAAVRDDSKPLPDYAQLLTAAQQRHFEADIFRARGSSKPHPSHPNAWLKRLRLNKLYIAINVVVAATGAAFIVIAWIA